MTDLIINKIINNFDFTYMLLVNVLTYIYIKIIDDANKTKPISVFMKRILLLCAIITIIALYNIFEYKQDSIVLLNSSILAPVSWSWIFKPIINKLKLGYNGSNN